uniref:Uncharacterized protein n=1 Tax=Pelusios castaneus TaxID=367368 RepID=A0A8C8SI26_9SAUR
MHVRVCPSPVSNSAIVVVLRPQSPCGVCLSPRDGGGTSTVQGAEIPPAASRLFVPRLPLLRLVPGAGRLRCTALHPPQLRCRV